MALRTAEEGQRVYHDLLVELRGVDPRPHRCHVCGAFKDVREYRYALAMHLAFRVDWQDLGTQAITNILANAVGLIFGVLGLRGHGVRDKHQALLLPLTLGLCRACRPDGPEDGDEEKHPWYGIAEARGFTDVISEEGLARWETTN